MRCPSTVSMNVCNATDPVPSVGPHHFPSRATATKQQQQQQHSTHRLFHIFSTRAFASPVVNPPSHIHLRAHTCPCVNGPDCPLGRPASTQKTISIVGNTHAHTPLPRTCHSTALRTPIASEPTSCAAIGRNPGLRGVYTMFPSGRSVRRGWAARITCMFALNAPTHCHPVFSVANEFLLRLGSVISRPTYEIQCARCSYSLSIYPLFFARITKTSQGKIEREAQCVC